MPWKVVPRLEHVGMPDDSIAKIHLKDGGRQYTVICTDDFLYYPSCNLKLHPDFLPPEVQPLVDKDWQRCIEAHEAALQLAFENGVVPSEHYGDTTPEERAIRAGRRKNAVRIVVEDPSIGGRLRVRIDRDSYDFPGTIVALEGSA